MCEPTWEKTSADDSELSSGKDRYEEDDEHCDDGELHDQDVEHSEEENLNSNEWDKRCESEEEKNPTVTTNGRTMHKTQ